MKTRLLIIVVVALSCVFSTPHVFAEMTFSEFQIFCSEKESQNWELLSIEQRQRSLLCGYSDILSEKYYDWIGIDRDWENFAEQVSLEYAQEIPQYSETGIADSLIVNAFVSGRESFPPPMGARISFYYLDGNETKRFFEVYLTNLLGDFEKIMDNRTPTLKLFKMGYDIDEIKCKENLFLVQKYDGSPACVTEQTIPKLVVREWGESDNWIKISNANNVIHYNIDNATITDILAFSEYTNQSLPGETKLTWLQIKLESTHDGFLQITLPRNLIDGKTGNNDDGFFVLLDGIETEYQETKTESERILSIDIPAKVDILKILGYGYYNSELSPFNPSVFEIKK
jgi:hypothetical protein